MSASIIYQVLKIDPPVTDLVVTRIYPGIAPQTEIKPFIVYQKINTDPSDRKSGPSLLDTIRVQVKSVSDSYDKAEELADKTRTALDRYSGTINGVNVDSINFQDERDTEEDLDTALFVVLQEYTIRIKRT